MKRLLAAGGTLFLLSACASNPRSQEVLHNQVPWPYLNKVVEVAYSSYLGFGAPLRGGKIATVGHLTNGAPLARWRGQNQAGDMRLLQQFDNRDLAIFTIQDGTLNPLVVSDELPGRGEEVYWLVHMEDSGIGLSRGWVIKADDHIISIDGFFHPGTSGSPVLRADGTVVAIGSSGANWSCVTVWNGFLESTLDEKLECLFRKSFFKAYARATTLVAIAE